jgi:uncharacterized protein (TIGR00369 family)
MMLEDDNYCFICGKQNPMGLGLGFSSIGDKVVAEFTLQKKFQGYKDIIHGGIVAAILDEAMIKALLTKDIQAMTAELTVRFKAPLMAGEKALVEAGVLKVRKNLVETSAVIKKPDSTIVAEGTAKLIVLPK